MAQRYDVQILPKIPVRIDQGLGIDVTSTGGVRTIALDLSELSTNDAPAGTWYLPIVTAAGEHAKYPLGYVAAPGFERFATVAAATAATIATATGTVQVFGYAAAGDAGGSFSYRKVASEPSHAAKFQSANGLWFELNEDMVYPEYLGGIASATPATVTAAIENAIAFAGVCYLRDKGQRAVYQISSRIDVAPGRGLISDGESVLQMMTGSGQFDANTLWTFEEVGGNTTNAIGLNFLAVENPVCRGIDIVMQASGSLRTCVAAVFRGCTGGNVRLSAHGFQTVRKGLVQIDSCTGQGLFDITAYDVYSNDTTLGSLQMSGVMVDDNRIGNVYSSFNLRLVVYDIEQGQESITNYNYQTDGITVTGGANATGGFVNIEDGFYIDNVAEGIDVHRSNVNIGRGTLNNILVTAFKIVHDISNMQIAPCFVSRTGGSVYVVAGTNTGAVGPADIHIWGGIAEQIGEITLTGPTSIEKHFITTDGVSATYQPRRITWHEPTIRTGSSLNTVFNFANGTDYNVIGADVVGTSFTTLATVATAAESGTRITLSKPSYVRAYRASSGTVTTGSTLVFGTEVEDSNAEFNAATGIFTAKRPCRIRFSAKARTASLEAGKYFRLRVYAGGVWVSVGDEFNSSASSREAYVSADGVATLKVGDQFYVTIVTDATSLTLTGAAEEYTSIEINEIT